MEEKGADINDELKGKQLKLKKHENINEMITKRCLGNYCHSDKQDLCACVLL